MAQLGTVLSSNTFLQWLSHANRAYQRLDAFASDDQALTANTLTANVALNVTGTTSLTGANTNIQGGSLLVTSNSNFTEGVQLQHGSLVIYTDTGSPSYIDMYCGNSNIHKVKLQAPQHANAIGAFNRILTLPAANGTLLWGSSNTTDQTVTTNFTVEGNLTVNGTTTEFAANNITVNDPLIKLAANNEVSDSIDIGFVGHYYDGSQSQHAGLFRDASDSGTFKLFKTYAIEPNTALTIDTTDGSFALGDLDVNTIDAQVITLAGANLATRLNSDLANTNVYIATKTTESTALLRLANTNSYIAAVQADVDANEATERAALANTNLYIAAVQADVDANEATERAALANTNSYIATKLATAGGTMTGDVLYNDSIKANFGAGSDLQIYHDGTNSFIHDSGTGNLYIRASNALYLNNADNTQVYADFANGAGVNLYHNNSAKLATDTAGVTVTGNITVTGTVDGRDVATDGTKLDGIESGATADQTASEILTLIKTVDGSGSGLDADLLDGVSSASFVRSDQDDTISATLTANRYVSQTYTATTSGAVTLDFASYQNFVITLNGNITLSNPSTEAAGQSGVIVFIQDGTGSRTCSVGTDFETADGGGITLSTTASRKDIIPYYVQAGGSILLGRPTRNYS
jgi:hypothetical protein